MVASLGTVHADDYTYPYLVFANSNGTQTTVSVNQLEIKFSNGQLVAINADGTQTLDLASLASMAFSKTGELTDAIEDLDGSAVRNEKSATYYDMSGRRAYRSNGASRLKRGVYVVRQADGSITKVTVQ